MTDAILHSKCQCLYRSTVLALKRVLKRVIAYNSVCVLSIALEALPARAGQGLDPAKPLEQYTLEQYTVRSWSSDEGCPSTGVLDVLQTRDGYLWLATFNGLARFDGVRFTVYNSSTTQEMQASSFYTLCQDSVGALWAGSNGHGLYRIAKGKISSWQTAHGLSSNVVNTVCADAAGTVWVGTTNGLDRITLRPDGSFSIQSLQELAGVSVWALHYDATGTLWIGTRGKGLARFMNGQLYFFSSTLHNAVSFAQGTNDTLWIAGLEQGLAFVVRSAQYCTQGFANTVFLQHRTRINGSTQTTSTSTVVRKLYTDRYGALWIGTVNGNLMRLYKGRLDTLQYGERLTNIEALREDHEGNLWIGTYYSALSCLSNGKFTTLGTQQGLPSGIVHRVYEGPDGTMWVGTNRGLAYCKPNAALARNKVSGTKGEKERDTQRWRVWNVENGSLPDNTVRDIYRDTHGTLWIATFGGLVRDDGVSKRVFTTADGLPFNEVRFITEDHEGRLWIGTRKGLACFQQGKFHVYSRSEGLTNDYVLWLSEDRQHRLWVGTDGGGAFYREQGVFRAYTTADGLPSNVVFQVHQDNDGVMWFATAKGLARLEQGRWATFGAEQGLPALIIFQMLETPDGGVWLTTPEGVLYTRKALLNDYAAGKRSTIDWTRFSKADGMSATECTGASRGTTTHSGTLWLPTLNGVTIVDHSRLWKNTAVPKVYAERLEANGTAIDLPAEAQTSFTLPLGKRSVEIHYTALSYVMATKTRFFYMLEGFDSTWRDAGTRRTAYYTNLPPNIYRFRVVACNNDGVWNQQGATLTLVVEPFFYETAWFRVLTVCIMGLLGYLFYRLRVRRLRSQKRHLERVVQDRTEELRAQNADILRQQQLLEEQAREIEIVNSELYERNHQLAEVNNSLKALHQRKNEVIGVVAHDLKNPLASIILSSSTLERFAEKHTPEQTIKSARHIRAVAERMNKIIVDLLDIDALDSGKIHLDARHLDIVALTRQAVEEFSHQARNKNITLRFESLPLEQWMMMDERVFRHALDNLLSNAIKYSPQDKSVVVRVVYANAHQYLSAQNGKHHQPSKSVRIEVEDEGPGLSAEDQTKLFQRFGKLTPKPTAGEHSTGLGLYIVKEFVEVMGGTVHCRSELGKGSCFALEFPLGEGATMLRNVQPPDNDTVVLVDVEE